MSNIEKEMAPKACGFLRLRKNSLFNKTKPCKGFATFYEMLCHRFEHK